MYSLNDISCSRGHSGTPSFLSPSFSFSSLQKSSAHLECQQITFSLTPSSVNLITQWSLGKWLLASIWNLELPELYFTNFSHYLFLRGACIFICIKKNVKSNHSVVMRLSYHPLRAESYLYPDTFLDPNHSVFTTLPRHNIRYPKPIISKYITCSSSQSAFTLHFHNASQKSLL